MDKLRQGDSFVLPIGRVTSVRIRIVRFYETPNGLQAHVQMEVLK